MSSRYGGVQQRWGLIYSELRQTQAQRQVDKGLRKQRDQEGKAWKRLCSPTVAGAAEAHQALAAFGQTWQATFLATATVYASPRDGQRGRPARDAPPDQVVYHLDGALASSLASALYLQKPERIMALLMVMTVCLLVYAALEYRIRQALKEQGATFPNQKGQPVQNPTARWVLHYFVGIHLLLLPGQWPLVLNLTEGHQQLLRILRNPL